MSNNQVATTCSSLDPHELEELRAFAEAIKDHESRQKIIAILEEAGLLPLSNHRRP